MKSARLEHGRDAARDVAARGREGVQRDAVILVEGFEQDDGRHVGERGDARGIERAAERVREILERARADVRVTDR